MTGDGERGAMAARLLGMVLIFGVLSACSGSDEETAIRELIEEGVALAEAHDLGGLMELTADEFMAEPGNRPPGETKRFLFVGFKRYGRFRILHPRPRISVEPDRQRATATLHFLIVNREQAIPALEQLYDDPLGWVDTVDKNTDLFTLSLQLGLYGGDWLVRRARLTRFSGLQTPLSDQ